MKTLQKTFQFGRAPELLGDFWFNSEPLSIRELQGRPIILFFWDYTSQQSLRLIPLINGLYALYLEYGVVCIGIHSPEFFFGRDSRTVEHAIKKNLILFPVLTDNNRLVTNAYRISSMPSICLIDNKGDIYDILSEIIVPERIERSIQYLLRQSGYRGELPILLNAAFEASYSLTVGTSHEIFTGYAHGALGNPEGYSPELPAEYADPKVYSNGKFYAHGIWRAERNAFCYEGEPNNGYLICQSNGDTAGFLVGSESKSSVKIEVNEVPIRISNMGSDVQKDKQGNTYVIVDEPRLISVLHQTNSEKQSVKFIPSAPGIAFYMFSFDTQQPEGQTEPNDFIRNN